MTDAGDFKSECAKMLECVVCMEKLDNPKVLHCQHVFCKTCLDNMIRFQDNGSGIITCPMKCDGQTIITSEMTTNELKSPYQLKGILDMLKDERPRSETSISHVTCDGDLSCANHPTFYCVSCNDVICQSCKHGHESKHKRSCCWPIKVDDRTKQVSVMCDEHKTTANYLCCEKKFICIYCKEREHNGHPYETIKSHADRLKEILVHPDYGIGKIEDIVLNAWKKREDTSSSIMLVENMLKKKLKERRIECLVEYISLLKYEEKRLLNELKSVADEQMLKYPKKTSIDFYKDILQKSNSQIVLQGNNILNNVNILNIIIPSLRISLTGSIPNHPLGNIIVENTGNISINKQLTTKSFLHNFKCSDITEVCSTLRKKLIGIQDELNEVIPTTLSDIANTEGVGSLSMEGVGSLSTEGIGNLLMKGDGIISTEETLFGKKEELPMSGSRGELREIVVKKSSHATEQTQEVTKVGAPLETSGKLRRKFESSSFHPNLLGDSRKVLIMDNVIPPISTLPNIKEHIENMKHEWIEGMVKTAYCPYAEEEEDKRPLYHGEIVSVNGKTVNQSFTLKEFKQCSKLRDRRDDYIEITETQGICGYMANKFNKTAPKGFKKINFSQILVMLDLKPDRTIRYYNMYLFSEYLPAGHSYNFIKWSNNAGYVKEQESSPTLDAFSHWTYDVTEGFLLVGNLQGYETKDRYILSDPSIHCKEQIFGLSNLGDLGIELFFSNHVCADLCRAMRLKQNVYMPARNQLSRSLSMRWKERKKIPVENLSRRSLRETSSSENPNRRIIRNVSSPQVLNHSITKEVSPPQNPNRRLTWERYTPHNRNHNVTREGNDLRMAREISPSENHNHGMPTEGTDLRMATEISPPENLNHGMTAEGTDLGMANEISPPSNYIRRTRSTRQ